MMKWVLIITIAVWGGSGQGGAHVSVNKLGEFSTKQKCEEAGNAYTKLHGTWYIKSTYFCVEQEQ